MREVIDQEVKRITDESYQHAVDALTEHREQLDALAGTLLERETLDEPTPTWPLAFPLEAIPRR